MSNSKGGLIEVYAEIPLYSRTIMTSGNGSFYDEIYFFSSKPEGEIQRIAKGRTEGSILI